MGNFRNKEIIQDEFGVKRECLRIFEGNFVSVERSIKPSTTFYEDFDLSALTGNNEGSIKMMKIFCEKVVAFDKKPEKCNIVFNDNCIVASELTLYDVEDFYDGKITISKDATNASCIVNLTIVY
jgi:hypothetical protein